MRIADSLIMELEQESKATRRQLERVPDAHLGWRPHPKSMSLGQLALHVAQTPGNVAQLAKQNLQDLPQFEQAEAASTQELLDAHDRSLADAIHALRGWDDAALMETWSMSKGGTPLMQMPRVGLLRAIMLNHLYHHRGQIQVYLRMLDVPVPSVYGPTADESPFM
jgi:uncharacterized damage-inducible protein DinB